MQAENMLHARREGFGIHDCAGASYSSLSEHRPTRNPETLTPRRGYHEAGASPDENASTCSGRFQFSAGHGGPRSAGDPPGCAPASPHGELGEYKNGARGGLRLSSDRQSHRRRRPHHRTGELLRARRRLPRQAQRPSGGEGGTRDPFGDTYPARRQGGEVFPAPEVGGFGRIAAES